MRGDQAGVKEGGREDKKAVVLLYVPIFSLCSCHCEAHLRFLKKVGNHQLRTLDEYILPRLPPLVSQYRFSCKSRPGPTGYCCQA